MMTSFSELHIEAMINALVRMVIEFAVLFLLYFWVLGRNTNLDTSWLFFSAFYALCVFVVPVQVQYELAGKYADKWQSGAGSNAAYPDRSCVNNPNMWLVLLPYSLPLAVIGAVGMSLYQISFFSPTWLLIAILAAVSIFTVLPLVVLMNNRCLNILYLNSLRGNALVRHRQRNDDYYFTRHVFPWLPVTLITTIMILYKMSEESLFATGNLDILESAMYVGSSCFAICLWMFTESVSQTRVDLKFNAFQPQPGDSMSSSDLLFLLHGLVAAVVGITYLTGYWFWPEGFSQWVLICLGAIMVSVSGAVANIVGVSWAGGAAVEQDIST